MEMAEAAGLPLVPPAQRNPLNIAASEQAFRLLPTAQRIPASRWQ